MSVLEISNEKQGKQTNWETNRHHVALEEGSTWLPFNAYTTCILLKIEFVELLRYPNVDVGQVLPTAINYQHQANTKLTLIL